MLRAGILPSIPYPGATPAWPGVCLRCGHPVKPRYSYIVRGGGGCAYCAGKRLTDEARAARGIDLRRCTRCDEIRPIDDFPPNPNVAGGRLRQCRACVNGAQARRWQEIRDDPEVKAKRRAYYDEHAEQIKEQARAYYRTRRDDPAYKQRVADYKRRYSRLNAARIAEYNRRYRQENRARKAAWANARRAKKQDAGIYVISDRDLRRLASIDACQECGSTDALELDHIVPLELGGVHSIGNLWKLCRTCNRSKGHRTLVAWRRWKGQTGSGAQVG